MSNDKTRQTCVLAQVDSDINLLSPLLRLPKALRSGIYAYCGTLGSHEATLISLNSRRPRRDDRQREAFEVTHSLLLTCHLIYEEVAAGVYRNNHIYIRASAQGGPRGLRRLRPGSIRNLTQLTVHLNVASCGIGLYCDCSLRPQEIPPARPGRDKPLCLSAPTVYRAGKAQPLKPIAAKSHYILRQWNQVWDEHIRPNLSAPGHLHLNLICDVEDLATGQLAVQCLLEGPASNLAGCSVRLCHRRDDKIQQLAEAVVEYTCEAASEESSVRGLKGGTGSAFRFFDLPPELRQHILVYTDLITPSAEIEWSPSSGLSYRYRTDWGHDDQPSINYVHGKLLGSHPLANSFAEHMTPCWTKTSLLGCYCRARHSIASSRYCCDCWYPPTSLFLACRALREDAIPIFFGHNRFVIVPDLADWRSELAHSRGHGNPALAFLTSAVARPGLRVFRSLDLNFPPLYRLRSTDFTTTGHAELEHWRDALMAASEHLNPQKLTLRIFFAAWWRGRMNGLFEDKLPDWAYRHVMGDSDDTVMRRACTDVLAPLRFLKGLARFFVYLQDPLHPCFDDGTRVNLLAKEEAMMEQCVMGGSYDALAAGKAKDVSSDWRREHEMVPTEM